ncbi:MAG: phage minor capsid protein [Firmicutes bacterium]|nr:phage minor capsid protein [Bacillota bacterium]
MLKPEYLQRVPDGMIKLYAQAEADILADMARRISTYDYWIPAVEHQAKMLEEAGMVREEILARLKTLTGRTDRELRQLMQEAGTAALKSDDAVYCRQGLHPPPVSASEDLQKILQAGYEKTSGTFRNLTLTTARTAAHQFEQALDRAYMQITLGGMDYNTAIRSTIKQFSAEGVGAIRYPTGRTDTIEVAVRRAVVTGVNQTALRLQDARADEMGADLVEVSAHAGARPSHAQWQGGIYSRSGKSKKYPDFVKTTGYGTGAGLGGWNCSHSFRPWFEGMSRTYDKALLKEYQAKDYEYNGVRMTEYEALQEQRKIERSIRRWKREQNALQAAGLDSSEASARITEWNRRQKDFLEQTGLKADGTRVVVGKTVEKQGKNSIIKSGAVSGARNPSSKEAREHAERYYGLVRSMKTDVARISETTGFAEEDIQTVKSYIFMEKHDLGGAELEYFAPDYMMAESWQRLIDGKPELHDITLLNHEIMERDLMKKGIPQDEAHIKASGKYNYAKEAGEYYAKIKKYKNK